MIIGLQSKGIERCSVAITHLFLFLEERI